MGALIFSIVSDPSGDGLELELRPARDVTEPMWAELAVQIAKVPALLPYAATTLARRCQEGYAAVAVWEGQIVGHVALAPIACRSGLPGALHTWADFCAAAGLDDAHLPSLDVYEFTGSWTAPGWRGKGVSMALHPPLLARWLQDHSLGLSGMAGLTSRFLAQLGWQILGWSTTPFVSSLIGMPLAGLEDCAAAGWQPPAGLARYEGPPIDLGDLSHARSQFCYFWVSDPALAHELDDQLATSCKEDLCCWRRAVLDVCSQPGALHRVALLP